MSDLTDDSLTFAAEILREAGVAVTPGPRLRSGARRADAAILRMARATADIVEGLRRLEAFMAARGEVKA
ncbi:MAG: hypothetical protein MZV49_25080 [Rhodopseudomonas palustris]|nr:hypothetical protein [Rhodopseudomonas palustris]